MSSESNELPRLPPFTATHFSIQCETQPNEVVAIIGSVEELGSWNAKDSLRLTRQKHRDEWEVDIDLPTASNIKYRYVILDANTSAVLRWETLIGCRFISPGVVNVSYSKPCKQSSTRKERRAETAVNGNVFGSASFCTSTLREQDPWWEVDLGASVPIERINVWLRPDAEPPNLYILVADEPFPGYRESVDLTHTADAGRPETDLQASLRHAKFHFRIEETENSTPAKNELLVPMNPSVRSMQGKPVTWVLHSRHDPFDPSCEALETARYVRVQTGSVSMLELAEVQVYSVVSRMLNVIDVSTILEEKTVSPTTAQDAAGVYISETSTYTVINPTSSDTSAQHVRHAVADRAFGNNIRDGPERQLVDSHWLDPTQKGEVNIRIGANRRAGLGHISHKRNHVTAFTIQLWSSDSCTPTEMVAHHTVNDGFMMHNPFCWSCSCPLDEFLMPERRIAIALLKDGECKYICPLDAASFQETHTVLHLPLLNVDTFSFDGILPVEYCVCLPFHHPNNNLAEVYRRYWTRRASLLAGHRGVGRSYYQVAGYRKALIRENTLLSFIAAGGMGCDMLEFDVLLSADRVPTVYHDFEVEAHLAEHTQKTEPVNMGIHKLSYRQLRRIKLEHIRKGNKNSLLARLLRKHWKSILELSSNGGEPLASPAATTAIVTAPTTNPDDIDRMLTEIPKLESVFKYVPLHVAFDIEVKYPTYYSQEHLKPFREFELNAYVDDILRCVFEHAGPRRILFSSFHPDVCWLLHCKQPRYPVILLVESPQEQAIFPDARGYSIPNCISFVENSGLQGLALESTPLESNPELVEEIRAKNLVLLTWGNMNSDTAYVQYQRSLGVDVVISDNIGDHTAKRGYGISQFMNA